MEAFRGSQATRAQIEGYLKRIRGSDAQDAQMALMSLPSHPGHYQKEPQLLAELVIPAMLELARTTEDDMARGIAIGNLLGLGEKAGPAVPGLVDLVGDDRALPHLANGAGKLGAHAKKLVPAFQGRLGDSSPTVRRNAAEGLGQIGPDAASATDALAKVLTSDDDPFSRVKAAHALGKIGAGAKSALPALDEAATSGPGNVRFAAKAAADKIRAGD
jgi:HEAT repeat protein